MATFIHDPDAKLDYGHDWAGTTAHPWLEDGETITASTWSVTFGTEADLTLTASTHDDTTTTVWVEGAGGTLGPVYHITNHVTTSAGREDDRTHILKIRDR